MKILLIVSGVLALLIGAALLFSAPSFMAPMGLTLDARLATLGQAQGAVLLALGTINLLARDLTGTAVRPVLAGNLVAQGVSLGVNLRAGALGLVSSHVYGAVAMHLVFTVLFAFFLARPAARLSTTG